MIIIIHNQLELQAPILNRNNLYTVIWFQVFLSNTNNLNIAIQFQVSDNNLL